MNQQQKRGYAQGYCPAGCRKRQKQQEAPCLQKARQETEHDYNPRGPHLAVYTGLDEIHTEQYLKTHPPFWQKHDPWQWRHVRVSQGNFKYFKYEDDVTDYFEPGTPKQ